jgi:hypothetical protein
MINSTELAWILIIAMVLAPCMMQLVDNITREQQEIGMHL